MNCHVFCFGRFSPLTIGHIQQFDSMARVVGEYGCRSTIYVSATHDKGDNPLTLEEKIEYIKRALPYAYVKTARDPFVAINDVHSNQPNLTHVLYYAGSDYFDDPKEKSMFDRLAKYGKTLGFEVEAKLSGRRDDRISASLARQYVADNDRDNFRLISPIGIGGVTQHYVDTVFDRIRRNNEL